MSYRVLARAYRSGTFDEVVGQEPTATTLKNAIRASRVHHGYLFTGTRGVGKTSMARILAKALNCQTFDAPTEKPCGTCDSCRSIAIGEDVDVVEIDAASNTGVDNIRELRSNTTLRPARSRFKVYIIDEVHMLSTGAFNALLKTLEEPPPHVKFILATTESHKVPATIQSRCQRFDFRAIDAHKIAEHLSAIAEKEKIKIDADVLRRIARLANGSMRDALSLLDKLLSYESEHLTAEIVAEIIPPPHDELAADVLIAVAESDPAKALAALDRALQSGRTVDRFCDHLIEHVRSLMLLRTCGADTELVDVAASQRKALAEQAARFDAPTYVYMIALLEELRRNVRSSGAARALADAAVVRLSMSAQFTEIGDALSGLRGGEIHSADADAVSVSAVKKNDSEKQRTAAPEQPASVRSSVNGAPVRPPNPTPPVERARVIETKSAPAAGLLPAAGSPPRISSEQREAALRDPLVMRVKELFDGTVKDVRPLDRRPTVQAAVETEDNESTDAVSVEAQKE